MWYDYRDSGVFWCASMDETLRSRGSDAEWRHPGGNPTGSSCSRVQLLRWLLQHQLAAIFASPIDSLDPTRPQRSDGCFMRKQHIVSESLRSEMDATKQGSIEMHRGMVSASGGASAVGALLLASLEARLVFS